MLCSHVDLKVSHREVNGIPKSQSLLESRVEAKIKGGLTPGPMLSTFQFKKNELKKKKKLTS